MADSKEIQRKERLLQIEKEYNEALKMSQSISSSLTSAIDSQVDYRTKLGKQIKEYNKDLKSSISELNTADDISKKILEIETEKAIVSRSNFGANRELGNAKLKSLDLTLQALTAEREILTTIEGVNEKSEKFAESVNSSLDSFKGLVKEVPILGGLFSTLLNTPIEKMKEGIEKSSKQFVTDFGKSFRETGGNLSASLKEAAGGIRSSFASLVPFLTNPFILATLAITSFLAVGLLAFSQVEGAAKKFREETGLLNSQTENLGNQITNVTSKYSELGVSLDDVSSAAVAFTKEFDNIEMASNAVLGSMAVLNKNFGVSLETSAKVNKQFQLMGGFTAETAQNMINTTVEAAKLAGVAPSKVLEDIADSSEEALKYFGGSVGALSKAAIQAAKLGTSIKEAAEVSDKLLSFESSINSELEASAILGTNINFNQARRLAANNDILGAQQAVVREVSKLGDLTRLNRFEQEALAEASGMPIQDLIRQQQIKERFGSLDKEQLAAANALVDAGMAVGDITEEQLNKETERLAKQQELQSLFDKIGNKLKAVGNELLLAFAPLGEQLVSGLDKLLPMVEVFKNVTVGIFNVLIPLARGFLTPIISAITKNLIPAFNTIRNTLNDIFGNSEVSGFVKVLEVIGSILATKIVFGINIVAKGLEILSKLFGGISDIIKGVANRDTELLKKGFISVGSSIVNTIIAIPEAILNTISNIFPSTENFIEGVKDSVKNMFDSLPNFAKAGIAGIFLVITSMIGSLGKVLLSPFTMLKSGVGGLGKFLLSPFTMLKSGVGRLGKLLLSPFTMLKSGVGGLGKLLLSPFKMLKSGVGGLGKLLLSPFTMLKSGVGGLGKLLLSPFKMLGNVITKTFSFIPKIIGKIGSSLKAVGKGIGGFIKGLAGGLTSLANPAALKGLVAVTLGIIGISAALRIAGPALEPFGKMMKSIFEGIASVVVPVIDTIVGGIVKVTGIIGDVVLGALDSVGKTVSTLLDEVTVEKVKGIAMLGPALISLGAGLAVLSGGGLVSGLMDFVGGLFGGDSPIEKLEKLALVANPISLLSTSMTTFAESLKLVNEELEKLDSDKINSLENFSKQSITSGLAESATNLTDTVGNVVGKATEFLFGKDENLSNVSSNESTGDTSLLEEIRGLRADLNSGKVAVYMDGIKVTQRISNVVENSAVNSYST